jgi:hypothetical protein
MHRTVDASDLMVTPSDAEDGSYRPRCHPQ